MALRWEGQTRASVVEAGDVVACEVGTPLAHIHAMESRMLAIAMVSVA
jgi:hypothetical protein